MRRGTKRVLWLGAAMLAAAVPALAQTGALEFVARITPGSGVQEPVRGLPFYLLTKSYEGIRKEADAGEPPLDMNAFIDGLEVSAPLKEWMKRNHWVTLAGEDFIKKLKVRDVMDVPEFYEAYLTRNAGGHAPGFPPTKVKAKDKTKNPEKYKKEQAEYRAAVEKYFTANPHSAEQVDLELEDINPARQWEGIVAQRNSKVRRHVSELSESRYLVARTEADLNGGGSFVNVPPGQYWLSTLDIYGEVGDTRLRWDWPITVAAGGTTRVELGNFNGLLSARAGM